MYIYSTSSGGSATPTQLGWNKVTKTFTDLSIVALEKDLTVLTVPANTLVDSLRIWVNTPFNDGLGNAPYIAYIGFGLATGNLFSSTFPVNLDTLGEYGWNDNNNGIGGSDFLTASINGIQKFNNGGIFSLTTPSFINVHFTSSVNFSTYTQGSLTFFIHFSTLP